jgi:hypothetical protein
MCPETTSTAQVIPAIGTTMRFHVLAPLVFLRTIAQARAGRRFPLLKRFNLSF